MIKSTICARPLMRTPCAHSRTGCLTPPVATTPLYLPGAAPPTPRSDAAQHQGAVDGSLRFVLTPLTSVKLTAISTIDESARVGVSGLLRRVGGLSMDQALRRWLIATVRFGYGLDDYVGSTRIDAIWRRWR